MKLQDTNKLEDGVDRFIRGEQEQNRGKRKRKHQPTLSLKTLTPRRFN